MDNYGLVSDDTRELKLFILPQWIYQAFTAKFNLVEIHEYAKLRQVVSALDVAHLEILRSKLFERAFKDQPGFGYYDVDSFIERSYKNTAKQPVLTEQDESEIRTTIRYLLNDETTVKDALSRFKKIEDNGVDCIACGSSFPTLPETQDKVPYRVVLLQDTLYIIVEEGFLSFIEGETERLAFLTQVLKSAYAVAPIQIVNRSVWYRQYLDALANSAPAVVPVV